MKGVIYIMTTAVAGLIKIGKTGTKNFNERMRFLEANGYYNVVGLKRFFAIELEDYDEKEALIHEIFSKHQVDGSELFALDSELVQQLLLAFDGKVVFPENTNKEREFDEVAKSRKQGPLFSFYQKGLKNGDMITFARDKNITAVVTGEREVEFEGREWKLSPLTFELYRRNDELTPGASFRGAAYWKFNGKKLKDLNNIKEN